MKPMPPATRTLCVLTAAVLQTLPALADGHHTGWCQGVHNPHNNYGCTGGNHYSGDHHTHTPDVTANGGNVQPGTTQGPSPQTVTVTGSTGATVVDPQNNLTVADKPEHTKIIEVMSQRMRERFRRDETQ